MMSLRQRIDERIGPSLILPGSLVYQRIDSALRALDVQAERLTFQSTLSSHSCRQMKDSSNVTCPSLSIWLRYDSQFTETRLSKHSGNWGDSWEKTIPIRDALNAILTEFGFDDSYVSPYTFVYVYSFESFAFQELGCLCIDRIQQIVWEYVTPHGEVNLFWTGGFWGIAPQRQIDLQTLKDLPAHELANRITKVFEETDRERLCASYPIRVELACFKDSEVFGWWRDAMCDTWRESADASVSTPTHKVPTLSARVIGGIIGCVTFGVLMSLFCVVVSIRPAFPLSLKMAGIGMVLGVRYPSFFLVAF